MKTQQVARWLSLSTCIFLGAGALPAGNVVTDTQSLFSLWRQQEALKLDLELDLTMLLSNKNSDSTVAASLTYKVSKKESYTWKAEVKTSGRYRLMVCDFPPLRFKIPKAELLAKGFTAHNNFKLVTHCSNTRAETDATLVKEYLLYEIYQLISEYGIFAKMAKITYRDTGSGKKMTRMGILIEDNDEMADRIGAELCKNCFGATAAQIEPKNQLTLALFQYMIGNTDWSIEMNRNLEIATLKESGKKVLVPYDFDFSGFVNAHYAVPNADLGQKNIRERAFQGIPVDENTVKAVCEIFIAKKKAIHRLIERATYLNWEQKQDLLSYINEFYEQLESGSLSARLTKTNAY